MTVPLAALELENVARPWLWAALIAAGAVVLVATYAGMFRRSGRRLAWALMLLRGAGLAALVIALAQPAWQREEEQIDRGRLAVVLDDSLSMSLADSGGESRYALACAAVERLRTQLADDAVGKPLDIDLFDIEGRPLADGTPAAPGGERTDLVRAVTQAVAQLRSRPLAGVALFSDGVDNTGRREFQQLADLPVPIYTVGFQADADAARLDLAVMRVDAPERTLVHNEIEVEVVVAKSAGPATDARVTIARGETPFAEETVPLPAGAVEQTVRLRITPAEAGQFVFTAAAASPAGERLLANNARHFPLRVEADPIRVFYIEGYLRFEYKYLKARLEDDPDVSLVAVVRRANPHTASPTGEVFTSERLQSFDVAILGDMEAAYLSPAEYQALVAWVEGGGSLMVLGGYQSFGPEGFRATPLADALPVVFATAEPYQSEEPFVLELTPEGIGHPIFRLSGDRVEDAAQWAAAPQLLGASLVERAKPGAEVLARNPGCLLEGEPAVVVATQRYGAGRTLSIAADTTWRWTRLPRVLGQPDTLFSRFWSQTIRWLAGRDEAAERPPLALSTDRPDYEVGRPVAIRALWQPRPGEDGTTAEVAVAVVDERGRSQTIDVRSTSSEPNAFSGTFYPSAGGRYRVAATLTAGGTLSANQATEFLVRGADLELADEGTNRAALQSLSALTGGVYVDIAEADELAARIERTERRTPRIERTELGGSPWLFAFFLAAVTGEWVLRRRNQMV